MDLLQIMLIVFCKIYVCVHAHERKRHIREKETHVHERK